MRAPSASSTSALPHLLVAERLPCLATAPPAVGADPGVPGYEILGVLGRGGMGVVYQARQTVMDRQVVIKVINKALLDQPDALERFRREVQAAAKLSHPNIVAAYDAEQAGDTHFLVMEYVEGESLDRVVRRHGPLPVAAHLPVDVIEERQGGHLSCGSGFPL